MNIQDSFDMSQAACYIITRNNTELVAVV